MIGLDTVVHARHALVEGRFRPASIVIRDGAFVEIGVFDPPGPRSSTTGHAVLSDHQVLLPGLVDTHVHVNEPGRTHWEGFRSATRAAAAGGITTIVDMPLNSVPPTVTVAALIEKRRRAEGEIFVDVGFWGGAVPDNGSDLLPLRRAGVLGFKCFTVATGTEYGHLDRLRLEQAMTTIAEFDGLLLVHAEDDAAIDAAPPPEGASYRAFLRSRPDVAESSSVANLIALSKATGCRVHVVHISSAEVIGLLARAKDEGVRITGETCPHYLALAAEDIGDGATEYACCPPIRGRDNQDLLWAAVRDGTIDAIVSDHSPSPPDLKASESGDFAAAWGGISSLQLSLPVVWSAARKRHVPLETVVHRMSSAPAELAGLTAKGAIAPGRDADLCAFSPDKRFVVDPARLHHRHPMTPYEGLELGGVVERTWLRGVEVDLDAGPRGRQLLA